MTDRKKRIFSWNHISDKLTKEQVDELKAYYRVYHINKLLNVIKN